MRISRFVLSLFLCLFAWGRAEDAPPVLEFERLDLTDGRKLRKVVVKNYDEEKDRLLLVAGGKAMVVSLQLVPEPYRAKLKNDAPKAGATTSSIPPPKRQPAPANPRPPQAAPSVSKDTSKPSINPAAHKTAALQRADRFYQYEHMKGTANRSLRIISFETDDPQAIAGWPDRYRVQGRAFLEYLDTRSYTTTRSTDRFEVITEQKGKGSITVVDFTRK